MYDRKMKITFSHDNTAKEVEEVIKSFESQGYIVVVDKYTDLRIPKVVLVFKEKGKKI